MGSGPGRAIPKALKMVIVATLLNLNSLLVKRQIDNPSSGAVTGGN